VIGINSIILSNYRKNSKI